MFYFHSFGLAVMACLCLFSCSESDRPEVDGDGLTAEITSMVPANVIDGLRDINHPIYGGANPPDIVDTFLFMPEVLAATNLPGDTLPIGSKFTGRTMFLNNQSENLEIDVSYKTPNSGVNPASRSYVVGKGCRFTIFSEYPTTTGGGIPWSMLMVTSGCISEVGIEDAKVTFVLLEDNEGIFASWREPGQGRMFAVEDALAERQ